MVRVKARPLSLFPDAGRLKICGTVCVSLTIQDWHHAPLLSIHVTHHGFLACNFAAFSSLKTRRRLPFPWASTTVLAQYMTVPPPPTPPSPTLECLQYTRIWVEECASWTVTDMSIAVFRWRLVRRTARHHRDLAPGDSLHSGNSAQLEQVPLFSARHSGALNLSTKWTAVPPISTCIFSCVSVCVCVYMYVHLKFYTFDSQTTCGVSMFTRSMFTGANVSLVYLCPSFA